MPQPVGSTPVPLTLHASGTLFQWEAEPYPQPSAERRTLSAWRMFVLCFGLTATAGAAAASWFAFWPPTRVETRIVGDGTGATVRAALANAALRIGAAPGQSALLEAGGDTLVIATEDAEAGVAWRRARSLAESLLNAPLRPDPARASLPLPTAPVGTRAALLSDRNRLLAAAEATDARAASVSASLTAIARDSAAGARSSADRKADADQRTGRTTLDKGAAALADLQLQRIQLAGRYQDDYPAVVALDGQIRTLRSFLQEEARRVDAAARAPQADPADPILSNERDRLRAELSQLNDRRVAVGAELATVVRTLAATPPDQALPPPRPPAAAPAPVLVEAATTITSGPDYRWILVPAATAAALLLAVLAWFKPRRRGANVTADLLLQRIEAALLPHGGVVALPSEAYPALTRDALHLRSTSLDGGSGRR